MIIYLNSKWEPVEKEQATLAKVIPDDINKPPYFVTFNRTRDLLGEIDMIFTHPCIDCKHLIVDYTKVEPYSCVYCPEGGTTIDIESDTSCGAYQQQACITKTGKNKHRNGKPTITGKYEDWLELLDREAE